MIPDINEKEVEKKIGAIDALLTGVGRLLKKHWLVLIIIGVGWLFWWGWNNPEQEIAPVGLTDTTLIDTTRINAP